MNKMNEFLEFEERVCIASLIKEKGVKHKCLCPQCTGKKRKRKTDNIEFPELLENIKPKSEDPDPVMSHAKIIGRKDR